MRAAYVTEPGGPEAIGVGELPTPEPRKTEVRIAVDAVAVNPVDTFIRAGAVRTELPMPFIVGRDVVGRIDAVGAGVRSVVPGQRVWCNSLGHAGRQGPTAEYAVAPAYRVYPLPDGVDPVTAVAVVHPAATAWLALVRHAQLRPGEHVLVQGAAGNVGRALVELARISGAQVIATASHADADDVYARGAHIVIDYADRELADRLVDLNPEGYQVCVDCSGHNDMDMATRLLAKRGRVVLLSARGDSVSLPARQLYVRDGSLLGFAITNASVTELTHAAQWINARLEAGGLPPRSVERLPLDATGDAHRRVEAGVRGRLVIRPRE
ncbi:MAG: NADPH:quinone reductase [Streptosporangiales bacterium]